MNAIRILKIIFGLSVLYMMLWFFLITYYNFDILLFSVPSDLVKFFPNHATFIHIFLKYSFFFTLFFVIFYPFFLLKTFSKLQVIAHLIFVLFSVMFLYSNINTISSEAYWKAPFYKKTPIINADCKNFYEVEMKDDRYRHHQSYLDFIIFLNKELRAFSSDFEKTSYTRKKIAELIDLGEDYTCLSKTNIKWSEFTSQQFYTIFYRDSLSVFCGGASLFLKNVYEDLGYKSYRYDMGKGIATHQTNIVFLNDDDKWIVQDAYFNGSFIEKNSKEPVDFFDLLRAIKANEDSAFIFQQDNYDYLTDFLSYNECQEIVSKNWSLKNSKETYRSINSGYLKKKNTRLLSAFLKDIIISGRLTDILANEFNIEELNEYTFKRLFLLNKEKNNEEWLNNRIDKVLLND